MIKPLKNGVWPTMITPFNDSGEIDYNHVEKLVEWYIERGVAGIFAVCQSSEMFFLTRKERVELVKFILKAVDGRVGVIASGHVEDDIEKQISDINEMAETGAEAVVLLPNRLAAAADNEEIIKQNITKILNESDNSITFGMYECPYPYKRVISADIVKFCADTNRFSFLKDTCCDANQVKSKIIAGGDTLKVFNANCAQLMMTLQDGAAGFSGVMANFHPELYVFVCENYKKDPELSARVQAYIGILSCVETRNYPVCAKRYLQKFHFPEMSYYTRSKDANDFIPSFITELEQLEFVINDLKTTLKNR